MTGPGAEATLTTFTVTSWRGLCSVKQHPDHPPKAAFREAPLLPWEAALEAGGFVEP